MFNGARERMYAATKVELLEHRIAKNTSKRAWENKAAEEAEIVLDKMTEDEREELHGFQREKKAAFNALKVLLRQPIGKSTAVVAPSHEAPLTRRRKFLHFIL